MNTDSQTFDALRALHSLGEDDLRFAFGSESFAVVLNSARLLRSSPLPPITAENFPAVVRELIELYKSGSRQLGEAIIASGELSDIGHPEKDIEVLSSFITCCESPFYCHIARARMEMLRGSRG